MLFLVPLHGSTWMATIANHQLTFLKVLPVSHRSPHCEWAEGLLFVDEEMQALRYVPQNSAHSEATWPLPARFDDPELSMNLAVVGDRAYLSGFDGANHEPALFSRSLRNEQEKWASCYPEQLGGRKHIDALVRHESTLIVVDDIVFPKYLFCFNHADKENAPVRIVELPTHGTYERILTAALCGRHLAVLSTTMGMGGSGTHLSLLDSNTFEKAGSLNSYGPTDIPSEKACDTAFSVGLALQNVFVGTRSLAYAAGHLVVCCGEEGLVLVKPDKLTANVVACDDDEKAIRSIARHLSLRQLPLSQLEGCANDRRPAMVTDACCGCDDGCVVVIRYSDETLEPVLLSDDWLSISMP